MNQVSAMQKLNQDLTSGNGDADSIYFKQFTELQGQYEG